MKHVKMLGLAAVAAMALMALLGTGSASATVLCSEFVAPCPQGKGLAAGTAIDMSLRAGGTLTISDIANNLIDTCTESTVKGKTANAGSATETVKGNIESMTYGKCAATFKDVNTGTFEIHYKGPETTGELTSVGSKVTVVTVGVSCSYGSVGGVDLGVMEADSTENPEFDEEATMNKVEGGFLCPGSIVVRGIYEITQPEDIHFKEKMNGE